MNLAKDRHRKRGATAIGIEVPTGSEVETGAPMPGDAVRRMARLQVDAVPDRLSSSSRKRKKNESERSSESGGRTIATTAALAVETAISTASNTSIANSINITKMADQLLPVPTPTVVHLGRLVDPERRVEVGSPMIRLGRLADPERRREWVQEDREWVQEDREWGA